MTNVFLGKMIKTIQNNDFNKYIIKEDNDCQQITTMAGLPLSHFFN